MRFLPRILIPAALLAALCPSAASAQVPVEDCRGDADPELAIASWPDVPTEDVDVALPTPDVTLDIENLDTQSLWVELKGVMDAGGQRAELALGSIPIAAQSTLSVAVPLDGFGIDVSNLAFSGAVFVQADLRDAAGALVRRAFSPTRFFHEELGDTLVYGTDAKSTYYNGGDLLGQVVASPGPEIAGVFDGGAGVGAEAEDTGPADITSGPPTGGPAPWEFCLRWTYKSIDSGFELPGGTTEDHYVSGHLMKARGMKVRIEHPSWTQPVEGFANQNNGCFTFQAAENSNFTVTLFAQARLGVADNLTLKGYKSIAARDQDKVTQWKLVTSPGGAPRRVYYQTQGSDVSNLMAFGSFTTHWVDSHTDPRLDDVSTLKFVTEVLGPPLCTEGCRSGDSLHLLPGPVTQEKFGVAHEVGHWLHAMWTNGNPGYMNGQYDYEALNEPMCAYQTPEDGPGGHAIRSKEYAAGAFTEGFAHFIAALAWNDHEESEGLFKYYKDGILRPSYDDMKANGYLVALEGSSLNPVGGPSDWLGSQCVAQAGFSTEMDWLRFFWDYRTSPALQTGGPIPTHHDIFTFLHFTRTKTPWVTKTGVHSAFVNAFNHAEYAQSPSFEARWMRFATSNGVAQ